MTEKKKKWLIILCVLAPVVLVLSVAFPLVFESLQTLPPIAASPNPNGYEDLIRAGGMVSPDTAKFTRMNLAELRNLSAANASALALARTGLSRECRVTTQFTKSYANLHLTELSNLKNLTLALLAEGRRAELENHPATAAKFYLAVIAFGNAAARGGVLTDQLFGTATEAIGTRALAAIATMLDAPACRETAATLEKLDAQRQTLPEVMQHEHAWSVRTFNSLAEKVSRQLTARAVAKAFEKPAQNFTVQQSKTRHLLVQLAARAYALDTGHPPTAAAALVPGYLQAVPQDPLTGSNLVFAP
jgi:hypothetical protein